MTGQPATLSTRPKTHTDDGGVVFSPAGDPHRETPSGRPTSAASAASSRGTRHCRTKQARTSRLLLDGFMCGTGKQSEKKSKIRHCMALPR